MRQALVAGNWKMNGSQAMARDLATALVSGLSSAKGVQVAICPPYPYLPIVAHELANHADGSRLALGAQDLSAQRAGAFTGDVAAEMLSDVGCSMVLVGHSERRHGAGETDALVADKFHRAIEAGLLPVLCVGETLGEREKGQTQAVVERQIDAVLEGRAADLKSDFVLAYEPVWAIGTGLSATPEQAQEVHRAIRARLQTLGADADAIRLLYGGSVKADNATELFAMQDIDGGLIGGASLQADDFLAICKAAGS